MRVGNEIHIANMLIKIKFMLVMESKFQKKTFFFFQTVGRALGAPALDLPLAEVPSFQFLGIKLVNIGAKFYKFQVK